MLPAVHDPDRVAAQSTECCLASRRRLSVTNDVCAGWLGGRGMITHWPVLTDALMLAECDECIHADSNVTLAAAIMNPRLVMRHVNALGGSGG